MEPHDTLKKAYNTLDTETLRQEEERLHERTVNLLIQHSVIHKILVERAMEVVKGDMNANT